MRPIKNTHQIFTTLLLLYFAALVFMGCSFQEAPSSETKPIDYTIEVKAEGWNKETSTPIVAAISNRFNAEDLDYYLVSANEKTELSLEKGDYTLSLIAPINADGSTYETPAPVEFSVVEGSSNNKLDMQLVPADKVVPEKIEATLSALSAISGVKSDVVSADMVNRAINNAAAGPNVTEDEVKSVVNNTGSTKPSQAINQAANINQNQTSQPPVQQNQAVQNVPQQNTTVTPKPSTPNNPVVQAPDTSNTPSTPRPEDDENIEQIPGHTHKFIAPWIEQKYVEDAPAVCRLVCTKCGFVASSDEEWDDHVKNLMFNGGFEAVNGHSYTAQGSAAKFHYEEVLYGYFCSCGQSSPVRSQ